MVLVYQELDLEPFGTYYFGMEVGVCVNPVATFGVEARFDLGYPLSQLVTPFPGPKSELEVMAKIRAGISVQARLCRLPLLTQFLHLYNRVNHTCFEVRL